MIDYLDNLLRHLFLTQVDELTDEAQVRFQPPDEEWRNHVSNLAGNALNVYLVDLRENRRLRSNERVRSFDQGVVSETPYPRRVDCHYLISAWSPAAVSASVEPTVDEHALLYKAVSVLTNSEPLVPRAVYAPGNPPAGFPAEIVDAELPTTLLPVEGFPKLAELWGTMGLGHRWRPVVYLVVTLPVMLRTETAGPMVTTRITEYRRTGAPESAEVLIQIGGHVLDATVDPPTPLTGAWVQIESTAGEPLQSTTTNALGRFTFGDLRAGNYQLRWSAAGRADPPPRPISVPSPTGEYDLRFE